MLKRIGLIAALFISLALIWYWPLLNGIFKPSLVKVGLATTQDLSEDGFYYKKLGISAPLFINNQTSPIKQQDWSKISADLRSGLSLAFEQESFENARLAFLTGHSSDTVRHEFSSVFASLGQADLADVFSLMIDGQSYEYQVIEKEIFLPTEVEQFRKLEDNEANRVALVTCWPPLTTAKRMVVVGELVN